MDLVPQSNGETLVKSPMVDVDAVDVEQVDEGTVTLEVTSEFETDSDDSDGDDADSDGGIVLQFLRDDQLHEGRFFPLSRRCNASYPRHPRYPESTFAETIINIDPVL
jgi:hypothetical protein